MFTIDEIELMLEALDTHKGKYMESALQKMMFGAMLKGKQSEEDFKRESDETFEEAKRKTAAIEENIILLKAKLIGLRKQLMVEEGTKLLLAQPE